MLASEAMPFAKTGGLADVMGALRANLQDIGLSIDEPFANDTPVREITSKFQGRQLAEDFAGNPRVEK